MAFLGGSPLFVPVRVVRGHLFARDPPEMAEAHEPVLRRLREDPGLRRNLPFRLACAIMNKLRTYGKPGPKTAHLAAVDV